MAGGAEQAALVDPRPRMPWWVADTLVCALIFLFTFLPSPGELYVAPSVLTVALTIAAAGALLARRRWPIAVLAAVVGLFGVAAFAGVLNAGSAFAVAVGAFRVTGTRSRRDGLSVTAATLIVIAALSLIGTMGPTIDPRVVQFTLTVLVGAAVGDASRSRHEYIAAVMERAERAEQTREAEARRRVSEERLRIARDLHDAVAHQISVISLNAGVASSALDTRPEKARQSLATIRRAARSVLGEIGGLLEVLRADDDTPTTAPQHGLDQVEALTRQFSDAGLEVTMRVEGDVSDVTGATNLVAYRVVREALTNAHKHGAEHRAHILLTLSGDVLGIVVTNPVDSGVARAEAPGSRLGLTGLRERVSTVRGTVEAGPVAGGWRVTARLPLTVESTP